MKFKIGGTEIENNIFLAPMAGITDKSYRGLCAEMGCVLTYSEMVSAKGLNYKNENTETLLQRDKSEKNIGIQLFGRDEGILSEMAEIISEQDITLIDINMGCPAPKIVKNFEGSALMKEPIQIGKIVNAVSKKSNKPLTIKIRKGFNDANINAVEIAKIAEYNGAAAITIHGRTREEYYSGVADWDIIKKVKENVKIPVIGNGDVVDGKTARKMFEYTNCDGIMVGRASQGNPWIFREIDHYLKTGEELERPSYREIIDTALLHTKRAIEHKGENVGIKEMRKHLGYYIKGMPEASQMRNLINHLNTYEEVLEAFYKYLKEIEGM